MIEKLKNRSVRYYGNLELLEVISKHAESLGFHESRNFRQEDDTHMSFFYDGKMFTNKRDSNLTPVSLEEFFSLKPEPKTKTITLEVTEDQEQQIKEQLGIH